MARGAIKHRLYFDCLGEIELPIPQVPEQRFIAARLQAQDALVQRCDALIGEAHKLNWLDEGVFRVSPGDSIANSLADMVEDVSEYVDPAAYPNVEWKVYGVTNEDGVRLNETKLGSDFKPGRKYKRLIKEALVYNPQRVNVGSIGVVEEADTESIVSPYYVQFKCKYPMDKRFAYYLFKSPYFRRLIDGPDGAIGGVRHELFFSTFTSMELPIPKPETQRAIIDTIDQQLAVYSQVGLIRNHAQRSMSEIIDSLFDVIQLKGEAIDDVAVA